MARVTKRLVRSPRVLRRRATFKAPATRPEPRAAPARERPTSPGEDRADAPRAAFMDIARPRAETPTALPRHARPDAIRRLAKCVPSGAASQSHQYSPRVAGSSPETQTLDGNTPGFTNQEPRLGTSQRASTKNHRSPFSLLARPTFFFSNENWRKSDDRRWRADRGAARRHTSAAPVPRRARTGFRPAVPFAPARARALARPRSSPVGPTGTPHAAAALVGQRVVQFKPPQPRRDPSRPARLPAAHRDPARWRLRFPPRRWRLCST